MSGARAVGLPVASGRATWTAVGRLARPYRRLVVAGALVLLGATLAALALPLLLGAVVDVVAEQRPASDLDGLVVALVAATLAQGVLFALGSWAVGRLGELLLADLREEVVDHALAVPLEDVERAGTGDLVARACGDVDVVAEAMREAVPEIVASSLIVALTVVGLATLDWRLALAGLAALPIQAGAARWYLRRSRPLYAAERAAEGTRSQQLHASVTGARTIRALRMQEAHMATITATSRRAVDLALAAASVRARFFSGLNAAELVGLGTVLAVSYPLVQSDTITVGGATAAALYFYRLFDPVGALLTQLDTAQSAGAALARLVGVASLPTLGPTGASSRPVSREATVDGAARARERELPAVRLRGVSFSYDGGRPALDGVDLVVEAGERVALVGPSGAGKSTVAKLVAGVHRATAGVVEVGGAGIGQRSAAVSHVASDAAPGDGGPAAAAGRDAVGHAQPDGAGVGDGARHTAGRPRAGSYVAGADGAWRDVAGGEQAGTEGVGGDDGGEGGAWADGAWADVAGGDQAGRRGVAVGGAGGDGVGGGGGAGGGGLGRVTLVTQEVHVFAGPLEADLRLARPGATDADLLSALDRVGATPWVETLADGLDTVVGEIGHQLSPTQAQQLALARLLLADPAVAILDEATAEAGSAGAGLLDEAAAAVIAGRTALVIAHRLTQAAAADRIAVLDRGRVVEQGTHAELLAAGGLYADLWSAWSAWSGATAVLP